MMQAAQRKRTRTAQHGSPIELLAMALIGSGLIILGVLAVVLLARSQSAKTGSAPVDANTSATPVEVDFDAPSLELTDLQGQPVSLTDYRGQFVLVNNWATWCPPCKAEMPTLQDYYEDYRERGFTLIAIEAGEPASEVRNFVAEYGLTFEVWPDAQQKALSAFRNLNLPSSYVIDPSGRVRLAWTGAITREKLDQYVTPLLED